MTSRSTRVLAESPEVLRVESRVEPWAECRVVFWVESLGLFRLMPLRRHRPRRRRKTPIRVGGNVQASKLVKRVEPNYPELAKRARVKGMVILQVTVGEAGNVVDIKIIRGHPLLNDAAVSAVRQWVYSPTLLNGEPVPVLATVTVNFVLR